MRLKRGWTFDIRDVPGTEAVAIINESMARRYFITTTMRLREGLTADSVGPGAPPITGKKRMASSVFLPGSWNSFARVSFEAGSSPILPVASNSPYQTKPRA
jgi:hypothetical protein